MTLCDITLHHIVSYYIIRAGFSVEECIRNVSRAFKVETHIRNVLQALWCIWRLAIIAPTILSENEQ